MIPGTHRDFEVGNQDWQDRHPIGSLIDVHALGPVVHWAPWASVPCVWVPQGEIKDEVGLRPSTPTDK